MQLQINAIKQLLETNNAIAESIDQCIARWAGESASWEQAATFKTAEEFAHEDNRDSLDPIFKVLWRSRIALNDARINAEEVDLDGFLGDMLKDYEEAIPDDQFDERDLTISKLNTDAIDTANVIAELDDKLEDHDREIENLKLALDAAKKPIDDLQMECDQLRQDLRERDLKLDASKNQLESANKSDDFYKKLLLELFQSLEIQPNSFSYIEKLDPNLKSTHDDL